MGQRRRPHSNIKSNQARSSNERSETQLELLSTPLGYRADHCLNKAAPSPKLLPVCPMGRAAVSQRSLQAYPHRGIADSRILRIAEAAPLTVVMLSNVTVPRGDFCKH
jgi:hypothetical protein